MRPRGRVGRAAVRAFVRQTEATQVHQKRVGRQRRPVAGAEHPNHRQVRIRRAAGVAGNETDRHDYLHQPTGLQRRRFVRQPVRRDHFVSGVPRGPGRRARGVGVRLEQKETHRQVPSTRRSVGEYEHTGRPDGQYVQVVRFGVRKTILGKNSTVPK